MRNLKKIYYILFALFFLGLQLTIAEKPLKIIVFSAHPDDCEILAGGTAALFTEMGHKVKFVTLTNGDKGHHTMPSKELAARRKKEAQNAGKALGVEYEILDNHDGELMNTLENRMKVIRLICDWDADIVITHRPNDYHPDHRYTSTIVQDAAFMVSVPKMVPGGKPLRKTPVYLYMRDNFKKPNPFSPDIVVDVTSVVDKKVDALYAHESQMLEWLPWNGQYEDKLPADEKGRKQFVFNRYLPRDGKGRFGEAALKWYTPEQLEGERYFEAFEVCEYGIKPTDEEIKKLFPMLPQSTPLKIIHLCDPQLGFYEDSFDADLGRFYQAIEKVNQQKPDVVLIAGDMVNKMEERSLIAFFEAVKNIKYPVMYTPGNHDLPEPVTQEGLTRYRSAFGNDFVTAEYKGKMIISANSLLLKSGPDSERKAHDKKLRDALTKARSKNMPVIIMTHIPPYVESVNEKDEYFNLLLSDRQTLLKLFQDNGVFIWLAGHTHTTLERTYGSMAILNGETTSVNFDKHPYGFRLLTIQPDNTFSWEFIGI